MQTDEHTNQLLQCLLHVVGRAAVPQDAVLAIVGPGKKQIKAFNLCDGNTSQNDIAKKVRLDQGNFSRTVKRWIRNGVMFSIGENKETRPLHIYAIPEASARGKKRLGVRR
ncbi:MAG: MarR family transcriptional regulator [Deltaproteobacteria bacterium]|nr:MAG: MarR family transcriptional regulator [Deltaproteobacteria bacterium]